MKVGELVVKLLEFDQDAEVVIQDEDEGMTLHAIESFGYVPTRVGGKTLAINAFYFKEDEDG